MDLGRYRFGVWLGLGWITFTVQGKCCRYRLVRVDYSADIGWITVPSHTGWFRVDYSADTGWLGGLQCRYRLVRWITVPYRLVRVEVDYNSAVTEVGLGWLTVQIQVG